MIELDEDTMRVVKTTVSLVGISALAAAARTILSEDRRSFKGFLRGLVLAVFAGGVTGALIQDFDFSVYMQSAIVSLAGFCADDILLLVISAATAIRKDPKAAIKGFFNLLFDWITKRIT